MATEARSYESPLRAEQRERTRARILAAAVELLADEGLEELKIPALARRAGVSVRTVYVHFATKDALLEAIAERLDELVGALTYPQRADDLPAFAVGFFEGFDRNEHLFTAAARTKPGREVSARRRGKRIEDMEAALAQELAGLDPLADRQALAAIYVIHAAGSWRAMKDYFGLTGAQAGEATAWAIRAMLRELERSPGRLDAPRSAKGDAQSEQPAT